MSRPHLEKILALLEVGECPEETRPALVEALQADDPELKRRALAFTGELIDGDELAVTHLGLVESADEPVPVRARAALALGPTLERCDLGFWDSAFEPPPLSRGCFDRLQQRLERVYRSAEAPKLVRRRVFESSVRAPRPWHEGAIRAAWNGEDPDWRLTAVFGMGQLSGFEESLADALNSTDDEILCEALRAAAGRERVPGALKAFRTIAADDSQSCDCRLAAIEGLRFVDSPDIFNFLEELTRSPDDDIAGTAAWALDEWLAFHREAETPQF